MLQGGFDESAFTASPYSSVDVFNVLHFRKPQITAASSFSWSARRLAFATQTPHDLEAPRGPLSVAGAIGAGALDLDEESAKRRCIGEFWERYCTNFSRPDVVRDARIQELPGPAVEIGGILKGERYVTFEHEIADQKTSLDWVEGSQVASGNRHYLPAEAVFLSYPDGERRRSRFWDWNTSGLAAGIDPYSATYSGALELIERDAFTRHWFGGIPGRAISVSEWSPQVDARLLRAVRDCTPWELRLVQLSSDLGLWNMAAMFFCEDRIPAVTIGAACRPDRAAAISKAIMEAMHPVIGADRSRLATARIPRPEEIRNFDDRFVYCSQPERVRAISWMFPDDDSDQEARPGEESMSAPSDVRALIRSLRRQGLDLFAVNVTTRDAAIAGFTVVRVFIPGLQLMDTAHNCRVMNLDRIGVPLERLNNSPHPFP